MPKIRVLIVEDDGKQAQALQREFERYSDTQVVGTTASGEEAQRLFSFHFPNGAVVDKELEGGDGLFLIAWLARQAEPPKTFYVTHLYNADAVNSMISSQQIVDAINKLNAGYCPELVVSNVRTVLGADLPHWEAGSGGLSNSYEQIERLLRREMRQLGLSPGTLAYEYMPAAILVVLTSDSPRLKLKEVFRRVGDHYHEKNIRNVEQILRAAVDKIWTAAAQDDTDLSDLGLGKNRDIPTVKQFIWRMAERYKTLLNMGRKDTQKNRMMQSLWE